MSSRMNLSNFSHVVGSQTSIHLKHGEKVPECDVSGDNGMIGFTFGFTLGFNLGVLIITFDSFTPMCGVTGR